MGKYINADCYCSTGQGLLGYNMFAYCNNNPARYYDPQGCFAEEFSPPTINESAPDEKLIGRLGLYNELRKITYGTGYEVHHLVEQRLYSASGMEAFKNNPGNTPSVILDKATHRYYTNTARGLVPYGTNYAQMDAGQIKSYMLIEYGGKHDWVDFICSFFE